MKRLFTIVAASALVIGVSLPAAALSKPDSSAASTQVTPGVAADNEQGLEVVVAAEGLAERDLYAAEPKAEPEPVYASSSASFMGSYSGEFAGMFGVWPTPGGTVICEFGCYGGHQGMDIGNAGYAPVLAAGPGVVIQTCVGWCGGWGHYVKIDHGSGVATLYGHMYGIAVSVGTAVDAGSYLGEVGDTGEAYGTHVHFEVYVNGARYNPRDFLSVGG